MLREVSGGQCDHCGYYSAYVTRQRVFGFRVRVCDECIVELMALLDRFSSLRPTLQRKAE